MDPKLLAAIIAVLMGLASVLGAVATYIKSRSEVGGIKADREKTKQERDHEIETLKTEVAVLKALQEETNKRLAEGTNQFKALDDKVDTTNNLLNQIVGALKNSGLKFSGAEL